MGRLWFPAKRTRIMDMGILSLGRNGGVKNWPGIRNARGIEHVCLICLGVGIGLFLSVYVVFGMFLVFSIH